jgi:phosphohistidine phosphatase
MKLYLVRHAIAVAREAPAVLEDRERPLTAEGVRKMRRVVKGLAKIGVMVDEIWTSPLVRAAQTADLLAEGLGLASRPHVVRWLEPGGDLLRLSDKLAEKAQLAAIALVGHEPDLGTFAAYLTSGVRDAGIELKKGGVACIELDHVRSPIGGRLCWLLTPRQLRALA